MSLSLLFSKALNRNDDTLMVRQTTSGARVTLAPHAALSSLREKATLVWAVIGGIFHLHSMRHTPKNKLNHLFR